MAVFFPRSNVMFIHFPKTGGCAFYSMLQELKVDYERPGFQHDPVDMLGVRFWNTKPTVYVLSREKESWFKSYHKWRSRNYQDNVYPGVNENWHPVWILEDYFHRNFDIFRERVEKFYPEFYDHLCIKYYVHPTFRINILPFENFGHSYKKILDAVGHNVSLDWVVNFPRIN